MKGYVITLEGTQIGGQLSTLGSAQARVGQHIDNGKTGEFEIIELNPAIFYDGVVIETLSVRPYSEALDKYK